MLGHRHRHQDFPSDPGLWKALKISSPALPLLFHRVLLPGWLLPLLVTQQRPRPTQRSYPNSSRYLLLLQQYQSQQHYQHPQQHYQHHHRRRCCCYCHHRATLSGTPHTNLRRPWPLAWRLLSCNPCKMRYDQQRGCSITATLPRKVVAAAAVAAVVPTRPC